MAGSADAALFAALCLMLVAVVAPGRVWLLAVVAIGISFAAGCLAQASQLESAERHRIARSFDVSVEGRVCELMPSSVGLVVTLCDVASLATQPLPERVAIFARRGDEASPWLRSLVAGDWVRARLRLKPLREPGNPGQSSRVQESRRRGVGATARLVAPGLAVRIEAFGGASRADGFDAGPEAWRRAIAARLGAAGPGGALLCALGVGDRSRLSPLQRSAFRRLGISHLLAVSGLHLALVAGLAYALLRSSLARLTTLSMRRDVRTLAMLLACVVATAYAGLSGWALPVRRALLFVYAAAAARLAGRPTSAAHLLALAAIVVLTLDPAALFELGAQLSFVASAALLYSLGAESDPVARGGGRVRSGVGAASRLLRTTATVMAVTAPVLALHGLSTTWLALVANLIAVPATSLLLLPLSLSAALAVTGEVNAVTGAVVAIAECAARLALDAVTGIAGRLPAPSPVAPAPWWLAAIAAAIGLCALRVTGTAGRVALAMVVVLLLRLTPAPVLSPAPPRIVSFDVGLGDATLVQGREAALLVDAGLALSDGLDLGESVVVPALQALGVRELDVLVATHGDADHRGGLPAVVAALPVGELWLPAGASLDPSFGELLRVARQRGVRIVERARGDPGVRVGDLQLTPLWPPRASQGWTRNDASLVLRVEIAGRRLLLTGDIGSAAERALLAANADLRAEVLKVGHHGSRSASTRAFLDAVAPELALVSAPCSAHSALPTREVLSRLREVGAAAWWTGRHGAIFVALRPGAGGLAAWGWLQAARRDCVSPVDPRGLW